MKLTKQIELIKKYIKSKGIGRKISNSKLSRKYGSYIKYIFFFPAFASGLFLISNIVVGLPFFALVAYCIDSGYGVTRTILLILSVYFSAVLTLFLYSTASDIDDSNIDKVMVSNIVFFIVGGVILGTYFNGGLW